MIRIKPLVLVPVCVLTLFLLAGRSLGELIGWCRASAQAAVEAGIDQVPREITDRKLDQDIAAQRRNLQDNQVALTLSQREVAGLEAELARLEDRGGRRRRLLTEACPVLESTMAQGRSEVDFAGTTYSLTDFQRYLDELLGEQEQEARQIEIRRAGLEKLKSGIVGGATAVTETRNALLALENEVEILRARRTQAEIEERTLHVVAAVSDAPQGQPEAVFGQEAQRLREHVDKLEAGNEAARDLMAKGTGSNRIARDWDRLERLRKVVGDSAPLATSADQPDGPDGR